MELFGLASTLARMKQKKHEAPKEGTTRGPLGDARPDADRHDSRTRGSLPQEDVEDRDNVSIVKPEDYPEADRAISKPD